MNPEDVVRSFLSEFETSGVDPASAYVADDFVLATTNPPTTGGRDAFIGQGMLIKEAMPDYQWNVQNLSVAGDEVTVDSLWTGTHTGTFRLSMVMPGAPDVPATGIAVQVADRFIFTVRGDQLAGMTIDSPQGGGMLGFLQQVGVDLPPM